MPLVPVTHQSWLFVPPLDMPLRLRAENGRFGSLRPSLLPGAPPCTTGQVISADDPRNPTGEEAFFANAIHEAVDFDSTAGSCVYAAYSGRVVRVETGLGGARGNVMIDHHPRGLGFVTKYNHISRIQVSEGDFVLKGAPFAEVSDVPGTPQALHFELWAVVDRQAQGPDRAPGDSDLVPVDPTRALYAWEQQLVADEPFVPDGQVPLSVGVTRVNTIPFFFAAFEGDVRLHVPMYEPMTEDERLVVALLREAHRRGGGLSLSQRHSAFWGLDVVTQAELA